MTTTTDERQKSNSGSKLRYDIKNRSHIVQMREFMREKDYDALAVSESWFKSTVPSAELNEAW